MQTLQQALQRRLKQRKLYKQGIGLIALQFFKPHALYPDRLTVSIRGSTCHVKLAPEEDRQGRYLKKQQLLDELTAALRTQGWETNITTLKIS
ncbi:MAG: hypothetical protein Q8O99_01270 [bacterium]|nr:hypothetical protein [bacterium]